jgi:hypothetical protein
VAQRDQQRARGTRVKSDLKGLLELGIELAVRPAEQLRDEDEMP